MSSAFNFGNGLVKPLSSTIGSSTPTTLTMKLPLPGFSLLISTIAFDPTPFWIFKDRVLNAFQDLQASIRTTFSTRDAAFLLAGAFLLMVSFFFAATVFFLVSDLSFSWEAILLALVEERELLAILSLTEGVCD